MANTQNSNPNITPLESTQFDAIMDIAARPNTVFVRGEGDWLFDQHNQRYIDWVQGWAVNCLGHCHPDIVDTINRQSRTLINCSPAFYNNPMLELSKLLTNNSCTDRVFFANSGAEANEGAIKLARKWGKLHRQGAYEIITFENSFHGRTLSTMAATGKKAWQNLFQPVAPGFAKATYNDMASVASVCSQNTVAIMLEPIQGEGGVIPAEIEFMQNLKRFTEDNNLLLICDEIQTGIGRTGKLFAYEHFNIEPDIITLGKGLGGGVPISALLAKEHICCFEHGEQGGTFNGNPLMTAVAKTVFSIVSEKSFLKLVNERSTYFKNQLEKLTHKYTGCSLRGEGLLLAMELPKPVAKKVVEIAFNNKLIINAPREKTLRFMPSLTLAEQTIDEGLEILDQILDDILLK